MVATQLPLTFSVAGAIKAPDTTSDERRRLMRIVNRLLIGDAFEVADARHEIIRVERVDFYRYREHYRIFHRNRLFIIQIQGQRTKAQWRLIQYLMEAGIAIADIRVDECSALCAYESPCRTSPIILLANPKRSRR